MNSLKNHAGFTFLELVVTITLISIALGFSLLYGQTAQVRNSLSGEVDRFVSYVRLAQSDAAAGKDNTSHGIHLTTSAYIIFEGSTYNASDTQNITITLPDPVEIQNTALNGGGADLIFTTPDGETTTYGTLDFVSSQIGKTTTVTISQLGTVHY